MDPFDKDPDDSALRKRMAELKSALDKASETRDGGDSKGGGGASDSRTVGLGLRVGSELIGGILVGAAVGLLIDRAASTTPLFLIIFLMLGTAAGFLNIYRLTMRDKSRPKDGGGAG